MNIGNCSTSIFDHNFDSILYRNSSYKIKSNDAIFVDTINGEVSFILPANPEPGDKVLFLDYSNSWNINNVTIVNNTKKILGKNENLVLNVNNKSILLLYYGDNSFYQWNVFIF